MENYKKLENKEATGGGSAGGYSAPLFGDMNEEETEGVGELNFFKSLYNPDQKSFIGAYKIINDTSDKVIEVLNIQEEISEKKFFADSASSYTIRIFKFKLPKSQIEILDEDTGFDGFKYIKIPYWLVKKDPEPFKIKRKDIKKRLDNIYNREVSNISGKVDDNVVDYLKSTNGDNETIRKIKKQKDGFTTKTETKEATGSGSSGSYEQPSIWAKSSSKKHWRGASKTQIPGGKFVEVKKKCQKFPYCNQGDVKALNIFENKRLMDVIKEISKKHNINEGVIKNILKYEMQIFNKYKK